MTPIPIARKMIPPRKSKLRRLRQKSAPTEDTLRQCGHLARLFFNVSNKNVSWQWPHVTRHIPGIGSNGGVTGLGAKLMMRLQLGRGQATRWDELLQMSKQLHGHRTYFFPAGAFRIGVASLHCKHFTTCCSFFQEMSISAWQTRHVTIILFCCSCWYDGGTSSGPIGDALTIGCTDPESCDCCCCCDCFKRGCFSDSLSIVASGCTVSALSCCGP